MGSGVGVGVRVWVRVTGGSRVRLGALWTQRLEQVG